jgi:hypothetical protein
MSVVNPVLRDKPNWNHRYDSLRYRNAGFQETQVDPRFDRRGLMGPTEKAVQGDITVES